MSLFRFALLSMGLLASFPSSSVDTDLKCAEAKTEVDKLICNSPKLLKLNQELAAALESLRSSTGLDSSQKCWQWIRDGACRPPSEKCIAEDFESRLRHLNGRKFGPCSTKKLDLMSVRPGSPNLSAEILYEKVSGVNMVKALKILSANELLQLIRADVYGAQLEASTGSDLNFDGFNDLLAFPQPSGSGRNVNYSVYLFDAKSNSFVYHKQLSELSNPNVDPRAKTVISESSPDTGRSVVATYRWRTQSELEIFEEVEYRQSDPNGPLTVIKRELINGQLKEVSRKVE